MSFYENKILPYIVNCTCSFDALMKLRTKVVPLAYGNVLEVGMGSALNIELYNIDKVVKLWGLEPSLGMRKIAKKNLEKSAIKVEWLNLPGEEIPLDNNSVDSVVLTYTLCTIPDWRMAMKQIHRVLKPKGKIFFCEHGQSPNISIRKWQNRLNNFWSIIAGGCNLNRTIIENIKNSGFSIDWYESNHVEGIPSIFSYISLGVATKNL